MSLTSMQFGASGAASFAGNTGRNLTSQALGTLRYPSPFFDIAHMYLPSSYKSMLRWCRFYFLTNPIINNVVWKMSEYPVTDLVIDSSNTNLKNRWEDFFDNTLQFKMFRVESGLDYYCYGNSFISIFFPFRKWLICPKCKKEMRVDKFRYKFRDFKFHGECSCGYNGVFKAKDIHIRSYREIRLIRWNPENVTIVHNDVTGESEYFYNIPATLSNDIRMAKRSIIEKIPQIFIQAASKNKSVKFNSGNFFHRKRPTIAQKDKGWGLPMILPVLKDTFYLQILRKAQEAIAVEHIVPLRILFPQTSSASADVFSTVNISDWKETTEREILRWRLDNNYIPLLPLPMGQQTLGGDGRALSLSQEYKIWADHIVTGMGVPLEFAFGGMSYSGSNVSMRMLENHFIEDRSNHLKMVTNFIMPAISAFMGWPTTPCHFKKFKMADDLQRSAFFMQLNQANKLSDKALLEEVDWDSTEETTRIMEEQKRAMEAQRSTALAQATIQGEAQLVMQKYQMRGQKAMMQMQQQPQAPAAAPPPPAPAIPEAQSQLAEAPRGGAQDMGAVAERVAGWLDQKPDAEKANILVQMQRDNPQLHHIVSQMMQQRAGAHVNSAELPQPEERPARRGPEAQAV